MRIGPMNVCIGSIPRWRMMTNAAPSRPKTAPEAPTVAASGESSSAPNEPGEQRREVQRGEAHGAERRLEQLAEEVDADHVEEQVDRVGVQEAAGDEPPPLAVVDERAEQDAVVVDLAAARPRPPPPPSRPARGTRATLTAMIA